MNSATAVAEKPKTASYISDYDAIREVIESYNEAVRAGNSALMKASFHSAATFFGYYKATFWPDRARYCSIGSMATGPSNG